MGRPQTRGKKKVVESSDSDGSPKRHASKQQPTASTDDQEMLLAIRTTPAKPKQRSKAPHRTLSSSSTPNPTPKKPHRRQTKTKSEEEKGARNLHSYFDKATERQQVPSLRPQKDAAEKENEPLEAIEDDFSDYDQKRSRPVQRASSVEFFRKRSWNIANGEESKNSLFAGSQKFLKTQDGNRAPTPHKTEIETWHRDNRSWTEKYAPLDLAELAVHHKKVSDVRNLLDDALQGKSHHKLLVLKGPTGAGKTTTLSLLSKPLKYDIIEWRNPTTAQYESDDFVSVSAQFEDFMAHAGTFGGLHIVAASDEPTTHDIRHEASKCDRTVLLLEEFPRVFGRSSSGLQSFRSRILEHLATIVPMGLNAPHGASRSSGTALMVLIISESFISDASSVDNFTAHRILGPEILSHPGTAVIEFNPVAPTFINKALNQTMQKHSRVSGARHGLSSNAMQKLAEIHDIRNAISTLEFVCSNKIAAGYAASKVSTAKTKSRAVKAGPSRRDQPWSAEESGALSLIAMRESTMGLFHAVGKVLYNKRSEVPAERRSAERRPAPDFDLDFLLDSTGTDTSTFLSALHENYALSCFAADGDSEATLEAVLKSTESLSTADMLGDFSRGVDGKNRAYHSTAGENVRQEELAFHAAVRGMMHALPWPVKRQFALGPRGRNDAFKMFYPTDIKLWRQREETRELVDFLVTKALDDRLISTTASSRPFSSLRSVQALTRGRQPGRMPPSDSAENRQHHTDESGDLKTNYISIASGQSGRCLMILDRLPFISKLLTCPRRPLTSDFGKEIERVTHFTGVGASHDEESDDDIHDSGAKGMGRTGHGVHRTAFRKGYSSIQKVQDQSVEFEKLVLSEDDIEDD